MIMLPAHPVVRLALTVVGGMAVLACGFADVFRPAGPEPVTITYVGDTILHRDSTVPFSILVEAGGGPLPAPHLRVTSSDTTIFDVTAGEGFPLGEKKGTGAPPTPVERSPLHPTAPTPAPPPPAPPANASPAA